MERISASLSHASSSPTVIFRRARSHEAPKSNRNGRLRAKVNDQNDPLFRAAINAASLRFQETHRPEPLFLDPYAGCFVPPLIDIDSEQCSVRYFIATKFIDDKLLETVNRIDDLKQVVLLSDGMDTRPYRLSWPKSTMIFDISPDSVFNKAAEKLEGVGAKVPRGCLFRHVPLVETSSVQEESLCAKGFSGNRPSIWAIQGLPLVTLSSFEEILLIVSSLATNGCLFFGELPARLAETDLRWSELGSRPRMEKLFLSNGFRVNIISHEEIARSLGKSLAPGSYKNVLFVAEQLRFSDDQMETWRREFRRVEEEADEEGFEEL